MSNIKISQLTPKGANLASTDLLEISEFNGSGYETKSITGQEIIDAAGGGGGYVPYTGATSDVDLGTHTLSAENLIVNHPSGSGDAATVTKGGSGEALKVVKTSGSGNAMSVTGGVTQLDELHLTTDLADSYIASASTWNAKQAALVSGTNIKTINGSSVLGSGDLSTGIIGAHQITPLNSNETTSASLNANGLVPTFTTTNNRLVTYPFIPNVTFTSQFMYIFVNAPLASSICRILIYSNLNGRPNSKLYESSNLDCSTPGQKTATTSFTFTAGTTYWLTCQSQGTPTLFGIPTTNLLPLKIDFLSIATSVTGIAAIGSAPATFSVSAFEYANVPFIGINKA